MVILVSGKNRAHGVFNLLFDTKRIASVGQRIYKLNTEKGLFFKDRLFRTAMVGSAIFDLCAEKKQRDETEKQFITALTESYIFLVRSCYDFLPFAISKIKKQDINRSWSEMQKKMKKGKIGQIKKIDEFLDISKGFHRLRDIRSDIKNNYPLFVYQGEEYLMIRGKYFDRAQNKIIYIDERLSYFIMEHAIYFWMHMHTLNRRGPRKREKITSKEG